MAEVTKEASYVGLLQKLRLRRCRKNYLYWDFLTRNRASLSTNPRLATAYRTYDAMAVDRKEEIGTAAARFLQDLQ